MGRRNHQRLPPEPVQALVENLDHDGRGVAHVDGKATFIDGALPGEEVLFRYRKRHRHYDEGETLQVLRASSERVTPRCAHFSVCGGCSLQHQSPAAQISAKQTILLENLRRIGNVSPEEIMAPLAGPVWGYRRRARLGVKYVIKKAAQLVGFREKRSAYLAELERCVILHPRVGENLMALRELVREMEAYQSIPQIEVAVGDDVVGLVFRHLDPLSQRDVDLLRAFGKQHDFHIYLQPAGPDSVTALWPSDARLSYRLPEFNVELLFFPTDFTQVNGDINRSMVSRALELLDLQPDDRVLDMFCGLGNFTLPIARRVAAVVGVEGDADLVQRARDNARHNGLNNTQFLAVDLSDLGAEWPWARGGFDKILIDPPRTGALEVVKRIAELGARRIVYVSCNPATFARDAGELVHNHRYRLIKAGVMDMFPHTTHVECLALFERK